MLTNKTRRELNSSITTRVIYVPLSESPATLEKLTSEYHVSYIEHMIIEDQGSPMWWGYLELMSRQQASPQTEPLSQAPPQSAHICSSSQVEPRPAVDELTERVFARVQRRQEREDPPLLYGEAKERRHRLLQWRHDVAKQEKKARFMVLTNLQIAQIASLNPETLKQLRAIKGIGDVKQRQYGEAILYLMKHPYRYQPPPYDPLAEEDV